MKNQRKFSFTISCLKNAVFLFLIMIFCATANSLADTFEDRINKGKVLARLGNIEIHEGYLVVLQQVNPKIHTQLQNPASRKRLLTSLIEQELLYQQSKRLGVDRLDPVIEKIALYARVITGQAFLDQEVQKIALEYYGAHRSKFKNLTFEEAYLKIDQKLRAQTKENLLKELTGTAKVEFTGANYSAQ